MAEGGTSEATDGRLGGARRLWRRLPRRGPVAAGTDLVDDLPPLPDEEPVEATLTPAPTLQYVAFEGRALRKAVVIVLVLWLLLQVATWAFSVLGHFIFLLLLAWLVAIAMEPSISWFTHRGYRRGLGAGVTLLGLVLALAGALTLFGGLFFSQLSALITSIPQIVTETVAWLNSTFDLQLDPQQIINQFDISASAITEVATNVAGGVFGVVGSLLSVVFDLLTVLVFAFYIAADGPRLRRTIGSWLPPTQQRVFVTVWDISLEKTGGFVVSKVILATLSAFAHSVFFWLIDIPYWLPMGLFAGVVSQFVPTIGTYIGVAIPAIFAVFGDPIDVVWIIAFATVYQQVENYLLTPRVSRATMDIHPALALASVFVGAAFFGPIGAIIGIPLAAAVLAVVDTYGRRYELVPELDGLHAGTPA